MKPSIYMNKQVDKQTDRQITRLTDGWTLAYYENKHLYKQISRQTDCLLIRLTDGWKAMNPGIYIN